MYEPSHYVPWPGLDPMPSWMDFFHKRGSCFVGFLKLEAIFSFSEVLSSSLRYVTSIFVLQIPSYAEEDINFVVTHQLQKWGRWGSNQAPVCVQPSPSVCPTDIQTCMDALEGSMDDIQRRLRSLRAWDHRGTEKRGLIKTINKLKVELHFPHSPSPSIYDM